MGRFFLTMIGAMAEMERGLISERTQEGMDQLRATHQKFTQSIYGWDAQEDGSLIPNWYEQNAIDYMAWQVNENGMSATSVARQLNKIGMRGKRGGKWHGASVMRTIRNKFHNQRTKFPQPAKWGSKIWQR